MGRIFEPARFNAGAPPVVGVLYNTGQTFLKGALLVLSGTAYSECGANPATIAYVALQAAGSNPGYAAANNPSVVTGQVQGVSAVTADSIVIWSGRMVNGATDPVTPTQADIGAQYGVLKTGAGEWVVNQADTTNKRVTIVDFDVTNAQNPMVLFRFMAANLV
jgi:hypothetical protein